MEGLLTLLILVLIGVPIAALVVAIRAHARAAALEREIRGLKSRLPRTEQTQPPSATAAPPLEPAPPGAPDVLRAETLPKVERPQPEPAVEATLPAEPLPLPEKAAILQPVTEATPEAVPAAPAVPTPAPAAPLPPVPVPPMARAGRPAPPAPSARSEAPAPVSPRLRLEEQLGARLPVWIGSIALFLAGAYLVKYTFDQGLLTPTARVILGVVFGLFLLGTGEWLRKRSARIAQGITAAGVADLFACFLAAMNPYHLIGPMTGFVLLALTTAVAVALSLRQGPFVALLGLLGGFLTPGLIGAVEPRPGPLFTYLFALQLGLLVITRRKGWWPLSALTLIGALIWAGLWLLGNYRPDDSVWIGPFLIATIVAFIAATYRREPAPDDVAKIQQGLSICGAIAGMIMLGLLVGASHFSDVDWVFLGLLGAGTLVLARLDVRYEPLTWCAAALGAILLAAWKLQTQSIDATRFGGTVLALGGLYAAGAYAGLWGARHPARWAGLSVAAALGYLLVAYWALETPPFGWRWGTVCVILAGAYAAGAAPLVGRRARIPEGDAALAALLIGVTSFVSLAVPIELERAWIAVAWSLEIPALAAVAWWLRVPTLRTLAGGLAALATIWLLQPGVLYFPLGAPRIFDWILYGYGLSALAFAGGAWLFHRQGAARLAEALEAGAALFVFALVTLKVRHFFHPDGLHAEGFFLKEWATYVNACLVLGGVALATGHGWTERVLRGAGHILAAAGAIFAVLLLCLVFNPLWHPEPLGTTPVFNYLLYIYGLPGAILLILASRVFQRTDTPQGHTHVGVGVFLFFVLVSLEVRHFFSAADLGAARILLREWSTYVSAWLVLGAAALVAARYWQRQVLHIAGHVLAAAGAVAAVLVLCLIFNPLWHREAVGATPIFNYLLYIYGLPGLTLLLLAGRTFHGSDTSQARTHASIAVLLFFVLVSLEVRHFFHGEDLGADRVLLREWSTYVSAWLVLGAAALVAARYWQREVLRAAGYIIPGLATAVALIALGLTHNPIWHHESVGVARVLNHLPYIYGVPPLLLLALVGLFFRRSEPVQARLAAAIALLLVFLLVTLEVRQGFRGEFLDVGSPTSAESYAYSAAWVLLGTLLLVAGIATRGLVLRWASLAVMLLAVGKVFLFDTGHLRDLYRVFSLLGLGVSLLLLAFLYQRFVFRREDTGDASDSTTSVRGAPQP